MLSMIFVGIYITYLCIVNYNLHQLKKDLSLQNNHISLNDSITNEKYNNIMIIETVDGIKYIISNIIDQKQNINFYDYDAEFLIYPEFM
jgi:hypothetical protein